MLVKVDTKFVFINLLIKAFECVICKETNGVILLPTCSWMLCLCAMLDQQQQVSLIAQPTEV